MSSSCTNFDLIIGEQWQKDGRFPLHANIIDATRISPLWQPLSDDVQFTDLAAYLRDLIGNKENVETFSRKLYRFLFPEPVPEDGAAAQQKINKLLQPNVGFVTKHPDSAPYSASKIFSPTDC